MEIDDSEQTHKNKIYALALPDGQHFDITNNVLDNDDVVVVAIDVTAMFAWVGAYLKPFMVNFVEQQWKTINDKHTQVDSESTNV